MGPSIQKLVQIINQNSISISFFTLEISTKINAAEKENKVTELYHFLKTELSKYFVMNFEIVDIQIGFPKKLLTLTAKAHDLLLKVLYYYYFFNLLFILEKYFNQKIFKFLSLKSKISR